MADPDSALSAGFVVDHLGQPQNRPGQWFCLLIRDGEHYRGFGPTWREAMTEAMHDPDPIMPTYAEDLEFVAANMLAQAPDLRTILSALKPAKLPPTFKGRL